MEFILLAGDGLNEGHCLRDQCVALSDPLHGPTHPCCGHSTKGRGPNQEGILQGIAYFSRSPDSVRMDAGKETDESDDVEGLRLVRAFLLLSPDRRAEVIAFAEELARAHAEAKEGEGTPAR